MLKLLNLLVVVLFVSQAAPAASKSKLAEVPLYLGATHAADSYLDEIQPVLNARCVACHGCYEAPCQLNLQSYLGLRRGFNPTPLFSLKRVETYQSTQMTDARQIGEWRARQFLPVIAEAKNEKALDSVLARLLAQGAENNVDGFSVADAAKIQKAYFEESKHQCISTQAQHQAHFARENRWEVLSFDDYLIKNPRGGMPLGLPALEPEQQKVITAWLESGAPGPKTADLPSTKPSVLKWEKFFNGEDLQAQYAARFIYEHIFSAVIYIDEKDTQGEYFDIVRTNTPTGPIAGHEIVTPLPYDEPGPTRAYYRLKKITRALTQKTQNVWRINEVKLKHLEKLFRLKERWSTRPLPAMTYGSNVFANFAPIPAIMRATFTMENSKIIVGAMVQGTVCIGSQATYAIADHFWAWFLKPQFDPSVLNPDLGLKSLEMLNTAPVAWKPKTHVGQLIIDDFLTVRRWNRDLALDISHRLRSLEELGHFNADKDGGDGLIADVLENLDSHGVRGAEAIGAANHFLRTIHANQDYLEAFERELRISLKARGRVGLAMDDLWMGDGDPSYPKGDSPNAWLNITRHERSATVQSGPEGGFPQSIWVMSYSNFERLYYNLVANYKVWGSVPHKLATWRHMSYVRLEGEDLAVSMLPRLQRDEIRAEFTRGLGEVKNDLFFPLRANERLRSSLRHVIKDLPPRETAHPELEGKDATETRNNFVAAISKRTSHVAARLAPTVSEERKAFETKLLALQYRNEIRNKVVYPQHLPNIGYVRVQQPDGNHWVYTLQADRGYKAHNIVVLENPNKDPQYDSLAVYRGLVGAYPGIFFDVESTKKDAFVSGIAQIKSEKDWAAFRAEFGVARNTRALWELFDWFNEWKATAAPGNDPVEQGIPDLSQYLF